LLKLKRVELQGFKSFCDRTEMRFNGAGIAAVVGPNGCGKSNLSDAISWVLGEQSAKSLRGSRMQDVIFAGTQTRKPVGMASVTMTLVDPANHLEVLRAKNGNGATNGNGANGHAESPTNGNGQKRREEITITRRLYRSGESDYLIDGKIARLRDIQDLFMGTGLGPESYAIIEQGRIGQILSSRPQDRRLVIEEAAGISKFKARRRLAEAKLEGARQNLARVFDILEEVGRQCNSLKRQANKAQRYKKLHEEMLVEMRRTLVGRFRLLEREATKTALDLNLANTGYQELSQKVRDSEREQAQTREQAYQTETELTQTRGRLSELRVESERTRGRLEAQTKQVAGIEQQLSQGERELQSLGDRGKALEEQLAAHNQVLTELEAQTESAREALSAKAAEREQAQNECRSHESGIEVLRRSVLDLLGEASALRNELVQIDEFIAAIDRDAARAGRECESSSNEVERLRTAGEELAKKIEARRALMESVSERRAEREREIATRTEKLAGARHRLEELRSETSTLRARRQSLDEILSHRAYTTESVKNLFTSIAQGQQQELQPLGVLADFVDVDPAYEKAAEEFLHNELEYIVVRDWSQAAQGIELMRRDIGGRATFLVHPEPEANLGNAGPAPAIGPETGIVAPLSSVLRMTNGLTHAPAELVPRLSRCMLVEDAAAARRLAQQYPGFHFLLPDGVCYHGYAVSGGKKSAGGPLALKRELREVTARLETHEHDLEQARQLVETLDGEIAELSADLETLRSSQQAQEKELVALESQARQIEEESKKAGTLLATAESELERLRGEKQKTHEQRERRQAAVAEKETARAARESALNEARSGLEGMQSRLAELGEQHSALRVELAEREERRRAEHSAKQRLETQREELVSRRDAISAGMERLGQERARLLADNIELDRRAASLAEESASTETVVTELETKESNLRLALAEMDQNLKQLRESVQEAQEKRSQIEVALAERRAELRYLDETARKELSAGLAELAESEEETLDEFQLAEAEERYNQLKSRIEGLGPVNPQALEEYEESQQRYDFLNAQRQDLLDSIRDTEKAIHDIDVESRKRFAFAFERVNENFREMFKTLFGGGIGEMRLTDPDNLSDSGIDIVASPPGKRLQNVLLLSGGEKALTALSLLMAIFQFQPSPFCILDEVDAPLDEPNIRRLLQLIRKMSEQTQFIIITHAKSTMEAAQSLYGVTMQEPGVSRLVSVRFQPMQPPPPGAMPEPQAMAVS